jgi:3'(2'), 5'-bisphosphate nucleotidase
MTMDLLRFARDAADIASDAGAAIMAVYAGEVSVTQKADGSPVTLADEEAEAVILAGLRRLSPAVPVIAEEAFAKGERGEVVGGTFMLVDPLDGTREFVSRNGEFTVNIALIKDGVPLAGCVYAPALGRMFIGASGAGAFAAEAAPGASIAACNLRPIRTRTYPPDGLVAVASRSHCDEATEAFLAALPIRERLTRGSSLKLCLLAEGAADVYPRFGPTMEWDIAAGHAVLAAAGGRVVGLDGGQFRYGKRDAGYRNGGFVAWGQAPIAAALSRC